MNFFVCREIATQFLGGMTETVFGRFIPYNFLMSAQFPAGQVPGEAGEAAVQVAQQVVYTIANGPAPPAEAPFPWMMLVVWAGVLGAMYFLMFRPQRKREQQMKEMQAAVKSGDNIVTSGGLFGKVTDVGTDSFIVDFGVSGRSVRIPVLKGDVVGIREPVMTPPPVE